MLEFLILSKSEMGPMV